MKIVFLDIDGVVATLDALYEELAAYFGVEVQDIEKTNPKELCEKTGLSYPSVSCSHWPFSPSAIKLLYKLQLETGCKFVMSSSWRLGKDINEINSLMATKGLRIRFIDKTENWSKSGTRGGEIQNWLDEHTDVEQYVIIGDECTYDITPEHPDKCVQTTFKKGFDEECYDKAVSILSM